jgi:hypothetical protein
VSFHRIILDLKAAESGINLMACESQSDRDKIAPGAIKYIALSA